MMPHLCCCFFIGVDYVSPRHAFFCIDGIIFGNFFTTKYTKGRRKGREAFVKVLCVFFVCFVVN